MKRIMTIGFLRCLLLVLAPLISVSFNGMAQYLSSSLRSTAISVVIEVRGERLIYRVNGKIAGDPLRALESLWNDKSKDAVVDIMIDPHATFLQLGESEGLVSKAGFQHARTFVYSRESGMREQILRNPSERYSAKP
jgi:hypothetical protein